MRRRAGQLLLGGLLLVAIAADLIASDLPLACRVEGRLYLVPCVVHPASLADDDNQTLAARAAWTLPPPIPYGPLSHHPGGKTEVLAAPSRAHLLGTDDRGRDVAARLVHGARAAMIVGPLAVAVYLLLGVACGLGCALGGRLDAVLKRVIALGLTFPTLFLLLALQAVSRVSLGEIALAIALTEWPHVARLTRAEALRVARSPHVEAARALGATPARLAFRHLLPLAIAPAVGYALFGVGRAVLFESALSFLGLGVPPPTPSWGELLGQAQAAGGRLPLLVAPSLAIAITVLACNLAGEPTRAGE
jgi:peptide/nickel transport system permease protein